MADEGLPPDEALFADFLDDYYAECDEHLTSVRRLLLTLEVSVGRAEVDENTLDELFRHFHSLKGISGMVELRPAENLAHLMEDYLRALRRREASLSADGVNALFDGAQLLEQVVSAHRGGSAAPSIEEVSRRVAALLGPHPSQRVTLPPPAGGFASPIRRFVFTPSAALMTRGIRVDEIRRRLAALGEILNAVPHVGADGAVAFEFTVATSADPVQFASLQDDGVTASPIESPSAEQTPPATPTMMVAPGERIAAERDSRGVAPSHFVRVDLARLDELMRHVGDLVISRARLGDALLRLESQVPPVEWRALQENGSLIERQLRTLREGIMRVRLVPVGEIFRRMPFVVRDLARETGKRVRLDLQGQHTEIDKFLIERMMDPVLHLVRNAVSHGIETADERVAAGKRPEGTITLCASTAGQIATLEVSDDGRGVEAEAVLARAAAVGLPAPASEDPASLLGLLCQPGFSTRAESDRVSGRGVGMAVVKNAVEELGGSLRMESEVGTGTRFVVELPVTLAIAEALIVQVGGQTFASPQGAVREVIAVSLDALCGLEGSEIVQYRGGALPILRLSRMFGLAESSRDRLHVLVIGSGRAAVGLAVDRIVGQREIVVRAATDPLVCVAGISGATDLGDGRVVLILDPVALARQARERSLTARTASGGAR